jgi:hypothetical protein
MTMETNHRSSNGEGLLHRQSSTAPADDAGPTSPYLRRPLRTEAEARAEYLRLSAREE